MVHFATLFASIAILSSRALAAPLPDSSDNEPAVVAPNGTPITETWAPSRTMLHDDTQQTTTTSAMYGSGHHNWNPGYDNCVQTCMNRHAAAPSMYTAPPSTTTTDGGNGGVTHTVLVAPAQGILRFSPFAVNASVGDTIHFLWGGSPHTVTRSSILTPCNKTLDHDGFFASGIQNKSFTFNVEVNTTDVITYYCGVPGHCPQGMFGFINPPNAAGSPTTVASMTPAMLANSSTLATQATFVANKTVGTSAETWGDDIDMSDVPGELQEQFIQNVWQTRLLFASNPGMLEGGMGAANPSGALVSIPADITKVTSTDAGSTTSSTTSTPAGVVATASSPSTAPSPTTTKSNGGAMGKSITSSAVVGVAVLVAFLAL